MTRELSRHRHISFTAHYTGYIWYQMGISHPEFATSKGKSLAMLVKPVESWAEKFIGASMRSSLKQRHEMLDDALKQLLEQTPNLQVLEIACGLSPRGWWFRKHYPQIDYRELDLPAMAHVKQQALQQIDPNSPEVLSVDLFSENFKQVFEIFDPKRPLVVISEGLVNYFDLTHLKQLISSISLYGSKFRTLHYLTDLYPQPQGRRLAKVMWSSSKLLKWMSRSAFTFHFQNPAEVQQFIQNAGFDEGEVIQPADSLYSKGSKPAQEARSHDIVWMVHAQKKQRI